MVVANVNSQNNVNSSSTIEFVNTQNKNNNKQSSTIQFTFPDNKSNKKQTDNDIKYNSPNTKGVKIQSGLNITRHLQLHFDGNLEYPENVYVLGNDYVGNIQASYFDKHSQSLVNYLNKKKLFDVKLSLKQIKTV